MYAAEHPSGADDVTRGVDDGLTEPATYLTFADQLGIDPAVFEFYAQRDETRREHAREIVSALELQPVRTSDYRELITAAAREAESG